MIEKFDDIVHFDKKQLFQGNFFGIIAAIGYSLAPLLIIFIASGVLNTFVLVTMQEFISWILILLLSKKTVKNFFKDIFTVSKTKLGIIVIICGLLGGPIGQILYVLSIYFAAQMSATATVLVNLAPIFVALLSRLFLKEKLSFIAWAGLILATFAVVGLLTFQIINQLSNSQTNSNGSIYLVLVAISLSLSTAVLYAIESTVMHYAMNKAKTPITDDEVVAIKAFTSSLVMLIFILPIASWIKGGYGYEGWQQFKILTDYYWISGILILFSSILNGGARILYFQSVKILNGSYGMTTQLSMLLWTPISSMLIWMIYYFSNYNFGIIQNPLLEQNIKDLWNSALEWQYYLFIIPILLGLWMIIFDWHISKYLKKQKYKFQQKK